MQHSAQGTSFEPLIKCSGCSRDVALSSLDFHDCSSVAGQQQQYQAWEQQAPMTAPQMPPMHPPSQRHPRPFVPKIDPFAHMGLPNELTPVSSQPSPISAGSGRNSPMRFPPHRKASMPHIRRPPSPELLSQDCAFPPFPIANKTKRKDSVKSETGRGRSQTPDGSDNTSVRSFEQRAKRSASVGGARQRPQHDRSESRPSTASSSRKPSQSSRSNSRQGSVDTVPPLPPTLPSLSRNASNSDQDIPSASSSSNSLPQTEPVRTELTTPSVIYEEPETHLDQGPTRSRSDDPSSGPNFDDMFAPDSAKEPSYKSKRPPPIAQPLPYALDSSAPTLSSQELSDAPPRSPGVSLTRTLTSLFNRKRTTSGAKRSEPAKIDPNSLRYKALSPEELPSPMPMPSPDALLDDRLAAGHPQIVDHSRQFHETVPVIESSSDESEPQSPESAQYKHHSVIVQQQDLDDALTTILPSPGLPKIDEHEEDMRRVSIDSASSYGSIGFSHKSTSSRSTAPTELHSKEGDGKLQSISQVSFDFDLAVPSKLSPAEPGLDSPTDPFYHSGSMAFSSRSESASHSPAESVSTHDVAPPPPPEPHNLHPHRSRRPSTPGTTKGICRGCSQVILGSQKSVSSKDGQLSGRYHKECFVCKTCRSPFATADFYVHDDQPYCAHHYHVVNNTLCNSCDKGIEGQYMETAGVGGKETKKFHPQCLKCTTCKMNLNTDYFELAGFVYCERDAFRLANRPRSPHSTAPSRPSPLNREYISSGEPTRNLPAGRFPERRTTRLMMTY